jgi:flagellar motor protein MotB
MNVLVNLFVLFMLNTQTNINCTFSLDRDLHVFQGHDTTSGEIHSSAISSDEKSRDKIDAPAFIEDLSFDSNYVVIGAFSSNKNAMAFKRVAERENLKATIEFNVKRKLYYVYILHTSKRQDAVTEALRLRAQTIFWDTWVFSGFLGEQKAEQLSIKSSVPPNEVNTALAMQSRNDILPSLPENKTREEIFLFEVRGADMQPLNAEINIIDLESGKTKYTYSANDTVHIQPFNTSGIVGFECRMFGYRKVSHSVNLFTGEASDGVVTANGFTTVPFELVKLKKGEKSMMYVFFYKDAAIAKPESQHELNNLYQMMKENPRYRIKIHGHTNGNSVGRIIEPIDPKNFFSLSNFKESLGTARKLSEKRALLIKNYLSSNGIDLSRIEIKAWGGKRPVYHELHVQAHMNLRVEIEVLQD